MADNSESIGGISVSIDGDYSPLQEAIQEATQDAQAGGEQIAGALNAGAAGADNLASAISQATSNLSNFSGAAETAATGIESAAGGVLTFEQQIQALIDTGSTLAEALNTVQSQAETMASALDSAAGSAETAAEQLKLFDEAATVPYADAAGQLNLFATELEPIGGDAEDASGGIKDLLNSLNNIPPSADPAKASIENLNQAEEDGVGATEAIFGALQELGNQFLALGEAFAITKGLEDFGQAALDASDSITRANISLTTLTGSAATAEGVISGLEQLGMADGLAMPSLLTAATRMQNMLGPSTDVVSILGQVANSAAVMGNSIDQTAGAFDRMASSGLAGARQLATMGLNLQQLATAMNTVTGGTNATADGVAKMFKAMDETDRITVLSTALNNLAGIAQNAAQQTFGGQWQQLANQWEQVMVDVGGAILPVISGLTNLMKVDILPWVKGIVDDFNQLPGPMKDAIVAFGLLVAAIAPVTLALGAFGLAISGVGEVVPIIVGLVETLTGLWGADAIAAGGAATATATLAEAQQEAATWLIASGNAATAATGDVTALGAASGTAAGGAGVGGLEAASTGLAAALGIGLASAVTGAVLAFVDLGNSMADLNKKEQDMNTSFLQFMNSLQGGGQAALDKFAQGAATLDDTQNKLQADLDKANKALENNLITFQQASPIIQQLTKDMNAIPGVAISNMFDQMGIHITLANNSMTTSAALAAGLAAQHDILQQAVNKTNAAMVAAKVALDNGVGSEQNLATATTAYQKALSALNKTLGDHVPLVTGAMVLTHQYSPYVETLTDDIKNCAGQTLTWSDQIQATNIGIGNQSRIVAQLQSALDNAIKSYDGTQQSADNVTKAENALSTAQSTLNQMIGKMPMPDFTAFNTGMGQMATDLKNAQTNYNGTQIAAANYADALTAAGRAQTAMNNLLPEGTRDLQNLFGATVNIQAPQNQEMGILNDMGVKMDNLSGIIGNKLIVDYEKLQNMNLVSSLADEDAAWEKVSGALNKVGSSDLPLVITAFNQHISQIERFGADEGTVLQQQTTMYANLIKNTTAQGDFQKAADLTVQSLQNQYDAAVKMNQPLGDQLTLEGQLLQAQINRATNAGDDANAEVVELNNVKIAQQNLITQTQGWGLIQVGVTNDIIKGMENIGQGISQVIVEGGNMAQAFVKIGQQIAETILTTIINGGMKLLIAEITGPLTKAITSFGSTAVNLGSNIDAMFGGIQKAVVDTGVIAGNTAVDLGNNVDQVVAGVAQTSQTASTGTAAAATAANAAVLSSTMMTVGAISSLIGALAGIVGDIEIARTNTLLGKIEVSTRETDAKATDITGVLYDVLNQGWTVWNEAIPAFQYMSDMLLEIDSDIIYLQHLMQTTAGLSADTQVSGILTDIQGVLENSILGELKVIDSDLNTMGTGVLTKIADLIGNDLLAAVTSGFTAVVEALTGAGGSGGSGLQMPPGGGVSSPGSPASIQPAASVSSSVSSNSSSVVNSGGNTTNNISLNISGGDPQATSSAIMTMLKQLIPQFSKASS